MIGLLLTAVSVLGMTDQELADEQRIYARNAESVAVAEKGWAEERCAEQTPPVDPQTVQTYVVGVMKLNEGNAYYHNGLLAYYENPPDYDWAIIWWALAESRYNDAATCFENVFPGPPEPPDP